MALPYLGFLLAMQAAGTVIDWQQTKSKQKLIKKGRDLEKAAIESNMEAAKLESGQASLEEMKDLRQNLGSQIAMQAARGTASGVGSALSLQQKSVGTFNQDERTRRLNLLSKEANLRAQNVLSGLHTLQSETQLGQNLTKRIFETLPVSQIGKEFGRTELGRKWGFGEEVSSVR
jgi:hypothetical protein